MSLLMDALKRAEKARQAEASSDGAELDLASTQGFSLDPIDEAGGGERPLPREPTLDQPLSPADTGASSGGGMSLENTQAVHGRLGTEEEAGSASIDDTGGRSLDDSISLIDDEEAVDVPHTIPSDTSATLPSLKQAQQSVDSYFDGTGSVSLTRDDLQSAMSNEATAPHQRVGPGDTETQRRVRAVFHAKEASRGRRGRNWVVVGLVPLLLLCIVGAVVFVYWDNIAGMVFDQSVATRRPQPRPVQPAPDPAPQPSTATVAPAVVVAEVQPSATGTSAASTSSQAPGTPPSTTPSTESQAGQAPTPTSTVAETTAPETSRPSPQPTMTELAAAAPTVAQVTRTTDESGRRLSADEQVAREIQRRGLAPASLGDGTAFKITRRSAPDKLHPRLARAYDAWRAGNLEAAKRDYARVLKSSPRNRNALLGLGAIAVREGEWDAASEYYTTLLGLNPKDSIAQAGIIAIHENVDPLRGESQVKLLLREEPEAPHLHFTLGNMYADQGRWGEAQTAYFNAHRLQSDNADYAYNVAVSLDQLGQAKAAGDYYRQALKLAAQNGAVFDQPGVRDRLLKLAFEGAAQ